MLRSVYAAEIMANAPYIQSIWWRNSDLVSSWWKKSTGKTKPQATPNAYATMTRARAVTRSSVPNHIMASLVLDSITMMNEMAAKDWPTSPNQNDTLMNSLVSTPTKLKPEPTSTAKEDPRDSITQLNSKANSICIARAVMGIRLTTAMLTS